MLGKSQPTLRTLAGSADDVMFIWTSCQMLGKDGLRRLNWNPEALFPWEIRGLATAYLPLPISPLKSMGNTESTEKEVLCPI